MAPPERTVLLILFFLVVNRQFYLIFGEDYELPNDTLRDGRNLRLTGSCNRGTCVTSFKCRQMNGISTKSCGPYGVCCETNLQCSATSKLKVTSIQTPTQMPQECEYIIKPYSQNVCQVRIDFQKFNLAQPTLQTLGTGDTVYACSNFLNVDNIVLCGNNDGQHIYLPFNITAGLDHLRLLFVIANRQVTSNWRLTLTQLECPAKRQNSISNFLPFGRQNNLWNMRTIFNSQQPSSNDDYELLAPNGCLQYHIARTGTIESFNFNNGQALYMPSMSYAICFKRQLKDSIIEFASEFFTLPNQGPNSGFDGDCHATVVTIGKQKDYLMIPRAFMNTVPSDIQPTYFCGTSLNAKQTLYSAMDGPFAIHFLSDDVSVSGEDVGFRLRYQIK